MKNVILMSIALSIFALAAAVTYHATRLSQPAQQNHAAQSAQTGTYQISPVAGISGVYRVDTRNGEISICSAVYENGCITLAQAHRQILAKRESMVNTAQEAGGKIDEFTREKAEGLRNMIQKFAPEDSAAGQ